MLLGILTNLKMVTRSYLTAKATYEKREANLSSKNEKSIDDIINEAMVQSSMQKPTIENLLPCIDPSAYNQVMEVAIQGGLFSNSVLQSIEPSPVSGQLGQGVIGSLGSVSWTTLSAK